MALLGDLLIRAGVDTSKLSKGLGKAQGYLKNFSDNILSTKNMILGFGAAIGAGVAVNALKNLTLAQFDSIDAASDMAAQLGTTTGALQSLQYAVSLTGSDSETLSAALAKMTLGLGKVGEDSDKTGKALEKLGLDSEALAVEDPVEAFMTIAGAIKDYGTASDQAAIAAEIFGNANVGLLNSINAGPEALAALRTEAEQLGLSVSDVDANKIGEAKDAMDKVQYALHGIGNAIIIELAPYITAVSTYLLDFAKSGTISAKTVSQGFDLILEGIKVVVDAVHFLSYGWNAFAGVVQGIAAGVIGGLGLIAKAVDYVFDAVGIGATGAGKYLEELSETYAEAATENFNTVGNALNDPLPSDEITKFQNSIKDAAAKATSEMENLGKVNAKVATSVLNILADVDKLNTELAEKVFNFGKTGDESKINSLEEKLNKEREALEEQKARAEKMNPDSNAYKAAQADIATKQQTINDTQGQLDVARGYAEQLKQLEAKKKLEEEIAAKQKKAAEDMQADAKKLIEANRTPLEKFQEEIEKINKLQQAGLIDDTVAGRAKTDAEKTLKEEQAKANKETDFKGSALAERNSSTARDTILANRFGGKNDLGQKTYDVNRQMYQGIIEIAKNTKNTATTIKGRRLEA